VTIKNFAVIERLKYVKKNRIIMLLHPREKNTNSPLKNKV